MNRKLTHSSIFLQYVLSFMNEIQLDKTTYSVMAINPRDYGYLPRPSKSIVIIKNKIFFILKLKRLFPIIWLTLSPLYFLIQFCSFYFKKNKKKQNKDILEDDGIVFLIFSERALDVFKQYVCSQKSQFFLIMPWIKKSKADELQLNLMNMISFKVLFQAYYLSVATVFRLFLSDNTRPWLLQSYTAFSWFLVYLALKDVRNKELICAEHYDRWAVLTDQLVTDNRLKGDNSLTLTMLQHGFLGSLGTEKHDLSLPYKLKSVSKAFVYNEQSKSFFMDRIIDNDSTSLIPDFDFFTPSINLTKTNDEESSLKILFVGSPLCENFHVSLFKRLTEKNKKYISSYYKPHPLNPSSSLVALVGWKIVNDKDFFPEVDLVITYPSTLDLEYSVHGIKTVCHPVDASDKDVDFYSKEVIAFLDKTILGEVVE